MEHASRPRRDDLRNNRVEISYFDSFRVSGNPTYRDLRVSLTRWSQMTATIVFGQVAIQKTGPCDLDFCPELHKF